MSVSTQKAAFISTVNLQGLEDLQEINNILKVSASNAFSSECEKL